MGLIGVATSAPRPKAFVVLPAAGAGIVLSHWWIHTVGALTGRDTFAQVALGAALGGAPLAGWLLAQTSGLLLQLSSAASAWVIGTQPYIARGWRDHALAGLYQHNAPWYGPGLGIGAAIVIAVAAIHHMRQRKSLPKDALAPDSA